MSDPKRLAAYFAEHPEAAARFCVALREAYATLAKAFDPMAKAISDFGESIASNPELMRLMQECELNEDEPDEAAVVETMSMSDRDALLQAILDAPDDDAPRLIYADWLDEHGESERAEFIRVQVAIAELPPPPTVIYCHQIDIHHEPNIFRRNEPFWKNDLACPDEFTLYALARDVYVKGGDAIDAEYHDRARGHFVVQDLLVENVQHTVSINELASVRITARQGLRYEHREKYGAISRRERELLLAIPNEQHPMNVPNSGTWKWKWSRGFIDSITCTAADCLAHLDAILREHPVMEVTLTTLPELEESSVDPSNPNYEIAFRFRGRTKEASYEKRPPQGVLLYDATRKLLEAEFPRIKKWNLPPAELPVVAHARRYMREAAQSLR